MTSLQNNSMKTRGGVEDTRLKAKDTKNFEAKAKNRPSRGQALRTQTQVFSKKRRSSKFFFRRSQKKSSKIFFLAKKVFKKFLSGDLYLRKPKKGLCRFSARFLAFSNEISTVQKYCCPRAEDRAIFEDLRLRGQRLQNVFSRTPHLMKTTASSF